MLKPWYWVPIVETSKLASVEPPSSSVLELPLATTLPLMLKPDSNVSLLTPPVKSMASAPTPPEMVPELMTVRLAPTTPTPPAPACPNAVGSWSGNRTAPGEPAVAAGDSAGVGQGTAALVEINALAAIAAAARRAA